MRPWFAMALIFLLGGASGALLTIGLGPRLMGPPGPQEIGNHWMRHLSHRLQLTSDQEAKIQPIVTAAAAQIETVHHHDVEEVSKIMKSTHDQITPLLDSNQQSELKRMELDRQKMFDGRMHGMHAFGDQPPDGRGPGPDSSGPGGPPPPPDDSTDKGAPPPKP